MDQSHDCKLQGWESSPPTLQSATPGAVTYLCIFPLFFKALHVHNKALLLCDQPSEIRRKTVGVIQQPGSITFREKAEQSALPYREMPLLSLLCDWLRPTKVARRYGRTGNTSAEHKH